MVLVQVVLRKKKYSKKWALGVSSSKSCATANAVNNGTESAVVVCNVDMSNRLE